MTRLDANQPSASLNSNHHRHRHHHHCCRHHRYCHRYSHCYHRHHHSHHHHHRHHCRHRHCHRYSHCCHHRHHHCHHHHRHRQHVIVVIIVIIIIVIMAKYSLLPMLCLNRKSEETVQITNAILNFVLGKHQIWSSPVSALPEPHAIPVSCLLTIWPVPAVLMIPLPSEGASGEQSKTYSKSLPWVCSDSSQLPTAELSVLAKT
uniref:Uncharacterized protein n=1 Tax=Rousettus aegyptiacus TaxID=9407 RepID=A0A7J8CIT0_ROUAE|nr:hypothetical protein HJG63_009241 [Rousettus aegyptiacus]